VSKLQNQSLLKKRLIEKSKAKERNIQKIKTKKNIIDNSSLLYRFSNKEQIIKEMAELRKTKNFSAKEAIKLLSYTGTIKGKYPDYGVAFDVLFKSGYSLSEVSLA